MKVKQNGLWKSLGGIDPTKFGNYTLLTTDMIQNTAYKGTATHLIIDDSYPPTSLSSLLSYNTTIISLVIITDKFTSLQNFFNNVGTQLKNFLINTSKVTNMTSMFESSKVTELDLSSFDTSNVTTMANMFRLSLALTLDLSSFDTSKVTSMTRMFNDSQATTLVLSSFNTSNVTNMSQMFYGSKATTFDLSSFDTSKVTNMSTMFRNSLAPTLDLSSFDTSKVTNMAGMFQGSQATVGYARTQADADKFNASSSKPAGLNFIVKP